MDVQEPNLTRNPQRNAQDLTSVFSLASMNQAALYIENSLTKCGSLMYTKEMQNQEELPLDAEMESMTSVKVSEADNWANIKDDDIMQQQSAIWAKEAEKLPFVGDKVLNEKYAGIRRTRGDGNCFFRSFMFSYL
ncbi:hypothetical protein RJ639_045508, partial [Escallonia herrerae]